MIPLVLNKIGLQSFFTRLPVINNIRIQHIPVCPRPDIYIINDTVGTIYRIRNIGCKLAVVIDIGFYFKFIGNVIAAHHIKVNRIQLCIGCNAASGDDSEADMRTMERSATEEKLILLVDKSPAFKKFWRLFFRVDTQGVGSICPIKVLPLANVVVIVFGRVVRSIVLRQQQACIQFGSPYIIVFIINARAGAIAVIIAKSVLLIIAAAILHSALWEWQ